jgi:hypothetical protein
MQIVWNQEVIEQMRKTQTLLELETFVIEGKPTKTYCVIPAEKLLADLPTLDALSALHNEYLVVLKAKDVERCEFLAAQLRGRFGGDLDTFYDETILRLKTTT